MSNKFIAFWFSLLVASIVNAIQSNNPVSNVLSLVMSVLTAWVTEAGEALAGNLNAVLGDQQTV